MIRLSRMSDYAVALLSHMGNGGVGRLWTAGDLATTAGLPLPTIAKIMKRLAKAGLITAHRGASGGYRLPVPSARVSIASVIEAMDGPIAITDCSAGSQQAACAVERLCPVSRGWNKVNLAVRKALLDVSLADMSMPASDMAASGLATEAGE